MGTPGTHSPVPELTRIKRLGSVSHPLACLGGSLRPLTLSPPSHLPSAHWPHLGALLLVRPLDPPGAGECPLCPEYAQENPVCFTLGSSVSFLPSALGQCPCVRPPLLPSAPACPLVAMLRGRPPVTSDLCRPLHLSPLLSPSSGLRLRRLDPSWLTLPVASRGPLSSSQNPCSPSLLGFWVPACLYPGEEEWESLVPTQSLGGLGHPSGAEVRAAWPAVRTHGPLGQRWRRHQCQTCGCACSQGHQAAGWTHLGHLHPWGGLAILGTSPSSLFLSLPPLWPGSGASPCSPGSNSLSLSRGSGVPPPSPNTPWLTGSASALPCSGEFLSPRVWSFQGCWSPWPLLLPRPPWGHPRDGGHPASAQVCLCPCRSAVKMF